MAAGMLRKCFELSGVVPLAVFVPVHVVGYASALVGSERFGVANPESGAMLVLEAVLIWVPLLFHGVIGARSSLDPLAAEPDERRRQVLLRATGMLAAPFIVLHAVWLRWPLLRGERAPEDVAEMLSARLSSTVEGLPLVAALHLVGLGLVSLHLAVGLPRFVEKWGLGNVSYARRGAAIGCGIVFALGAATVIELATGSAIPRFLTR